MTRFCDACRQHRPIREFDLGDGQVQATCRGCTGERPRAPALMTRAQRNEQVAALERQRRSLIAALVKIDAEIAELRGRAAPPSLGSTRSDDADVLDGADSDLGFGD